MGVRGMKSGWRIDSAKKVAVLAEYKIGLRHRVKQISLRYGVPRNTITRWVREGEV